MVILTLYFKDKLLKTFQPGSDVIRVGRGEDCEIVIDNLALAPLHAEIRVNGDSATVVDKTDESNAIGITVNHKKAAEQELAGNDVIGLGKYSLRVAFNESGQPPVATPVEDTPAAETPATGTKEAPEIEAEAPAFAPAKQTQGWLQFMNGPKLGRTIKLDNPMVRLGKSGKTSAMISTRDGNYFISHLEGEPRTKVSNKELTDSRHQLKDGETVQIGETMMMFFIE